MSARRICWLCAAVAATPLSLAGGWFWNRGCEPLYVAAARISIPVAMTNAAPGRYSMPSPEESFLSPEVVAAASDLLHERGIGLPAESRFDSDVDYLLERLVARCDRVGERVEIELAYRTVDAERAVPVLASVIEAGVRSLQSLSPETANSGDDTLGPEKIRLETALAAVESQIAEMEQRTAGEEPDRFDPVQVARTIRELTESLDRARAQRMEAEDQLALASRDVRSGVAIEQILIDLSKSGSSAKADDITDASSLRVELQQIERTLETASAVYGRRHPQMVALRNQLDEVRRKLAEEAGILTSIPAMPESPGTDEPDSVRTTVAGRLLKSLEDKVREATEAEQAIEREIERDQTEISARQRDDAGLTAARQEVQFLQSEHKRVCREIAAERQNAQGRCVTISEAPMLLPETIAPPLTRHLLWSGLVGVVVSGCLLRQFRKSRVDQPASRGLPPRPEGAERYRSQQEDNLARLRRLKPVA